MGYVYEEVKVEQTKNQVTGAVCDRCGADIELVWPDQPHAQARNASSIKVDGWFGGYYDPIWDHETIKMLLCEICSEGMFKYLGKDRYGDDNQDGVGDD